MNKIYLLLFFGLLIPFASSAQRDMYNWQISPYAGVLTINNDIELPENADLFSYGLRIDRRLGNSFTFGFNFSYMDLGTMEGGNIAGSFLSLAYHWDNGYIFSKRSPISFFNRIEAGYADKTQKIENLDGTGGDMTFGFENGVKFRLGDRLSADVAMEIFGTKASVIEGVFIENLRYNVWKVGVSYHFGERKSNFNAPVFVPSTDAFSTTSSEKLEVKQDDLWDIQSIQSKYGISRADSMAIFIHFDSLYQRKTQVNTTPTKIDSMKTDSISYRAAANSKASPDSLQNSVVTGNNQNSDTTRAFYQSQSERGRVDTVYVLSKAAEDEGEKKGEESQKAKNAKAADNGSLNDVNEALDNQSIQNANQQKEVQNSLDDIKRNTRNNNSNNNNDGDLGKTLAAGAAGVAVGALVSKDKKEKPDTVYYTDPSTQSKIDNLQHQIDSLKGFSKNGGVGNTTVVAGGPPIGQYYATDTTRTDSLSTDSLAVNSMQVDSSYADSTRSATTALAADSLSMSNNNPDNLNANLTELPDSTTYEADLSALISADSLALNKEKDELNRTDSVVPTMPKKSATLIAKYPVTSNFDLNSTSIDPADTTLLNEVVQDLNNDTDRKVVLTGHTDKSGNPAYNVTLSKKRAQSIQNYLTAKGIDASRIQIESKGAEDATENYNKSARRVEIQIIEEG